MSGNGVKPFYALYVEKELVGKRVKSSKVKVLWKFACGPELTTQEIQLKHSLVSGKKEVRLNGNIVYANKMGGDKSDSLKKSCIVPVGDITATIYIEDGTNGYVYDLLLDGIQFHKADRIAVSELEKLRSKTQETKKVDSTHRIDYNEFVNKGAKESNALDATASKPKEQPTPEVNLLDGYDTLPPPTTGYPVANTTANSGTDAWPMFEPTQNTRGYPLTDNHLAQSSSTSTNMFDEFPAPNNGNTQIPVADPFSVQHMQYKPASQPNTSSTTHYTRPENGSTLSIAQQLESLDFGGNTGGYSSTGAGGPYEDLTTNTTSSYSTHVNGQVQGLYQGTTVNSQSGSMDNLGVAGYGVSSGSGYSNNIAHGKPQDYNPFQQPSQPQMIAPQQQNTGAPQYQNVGYGNQQNLNPFA